MRHGMRAAELGGPRRTCFRTRWRGFREWSFAFHELAERELNDPARYYDREQAGFGAAFIADVRRCTDPILEHPEAWPIIRGRVRRRLCRKFRYRVLDTIRPGTVRVIAVMNLRRHPTYWVGRS